MATLLPSPTSSSSPPSNPYTPYLLSVSSAFPSPTSPSARTGVKARLILLFCALALLFFSSCGILAVHFFSKRLRGRRWWVWKWVEREGGRHVCSNAFILCGVGGLVVFGSLVGHTLALWHAFVDGRDEARRGLPVCTFVLWLSMAMSGYFVSWSSFQAFVQIEGGTGLISGRRANFFTTISPRCENALFIGGAAVFFFLFLTLAIVIGVVNDRAWEAYHTLHRFLLDGSAVWDGSSSIPATELVTLSGLYMHWEDTTRTFNRTAAGFCGIASAACFVLIYINYLWLDLIFSIRKQIQFHLGRLHSAPISTLQPPTKMISLPPASATPQTASSTSKEKSSSPDDGPLAPPLKASPPRTHTPPSRARARTPSSSAKPTRSEIRRAARDVEAVTAGETGVDAVIAQRILALVRAEWELIALAGIVLYASTTFAIFAAWQASVFARGSPSFGEYEALYEGMIWISALGVSIVEMLYSWIEWYFSTEPFERGAGAGVGGEGRGEAAGSGGEKERGRLGGGGEDGRGDMKSGGRSFGLFSMLGSTSSRRISVAEGGGRAHSGLQIEVAVDVEREEEEAVEVELGESGTEVAIRREAWEA